MGQNIEWGVEEHEEAGKFFEAVNEVLHQKLNDATYVENNKSNITKYGNIWIILNCSDEINQKHKTYIIIFPRYK